MSVLKELALPTAQGRLLQAVASIEDLPLDENIPPDHDDSLLAVAGSMRHKVAVVQQHQSHALGLSKPGVLHVPFVRNLRPGMAGRDVIAVQRALIAAGVRTSRPTGLYGSGTERQVLRFQKTHNVQQTGMYGPKTHAALKKFFDAYGVYLLSASDQQATARSRIVQAALFGYAHRDLMHYTQGAHRMDGVTHHLKPPKFPAYADCSAFATWCYYVAGVPDPNGLRYNGQGYTGTLDKHGKVVSLASAKPGDLVLYGRGDPWEHTTVYIGSGRCVSMGSEPGPFVLPVSYRPIGQVRSYI